MIIPVAEIVQPGFLVVDVAAVAEGVEFAEGSGQGAGGGEGFAPGVVGVGDDFGPGIVDEGDDVALQVMDVGEFLGFGTIVPFHDGGFAGSCMFLFAV